MRILPDAEAPVDITITPNRSQVLFHVEGIDLVSRLIEGQFPNYEPVVPREGSWTARATLNREEFLAGTRRASFFARDSANIVKVEVGGEDGEASGVTISAHAVDIGDNADSLDASVEGSPTTIAFNARYLTDVLGALGTDEAVLELSGPLAPGVIRGVGQGRVRPRDHAGAHCVLMLMCVSRDSSSTTSGATPAPSLRPTPG